jgi:hypothetical protein
MQMALTSYWYHIAVNLPVKRVDKKLVYTLFDYLTTTFQPRRVYGIQD